MIGKFRQFSRCPKPIFESISVYNELTDYLFSLSRSKELKTDLLAPLHLAEKLGDPQKKFPSIHIAGTNGKGTVAIKLSEVLEENGYRVGLFTSPHLFSYRERIQINGKMISREEVVSGIEKILPHTKDPKFFEITTLLAFDYFAEEEVDIAIIEAGLGGRLDATNIIDPLLTIITSIEKDHTSILGETLDEIAFEKGGIIKSGIPLVVGETAARDPIFEIAKEKRAPISIAREDSTSIARKALKYLPFNIETTEGLRKRPPCRYEKHGDLILDVAHNPAAFTRLFETIKREYRRKKIHVLLGMAKDKDIEGSLKVIQKYADHIALLPSSHPRLLSREAFSVGTPMTFEEARAYARKEKALAVVTGSFFIMQLVELPQT